jgi:hypothetical protein
MNASLSIPRCCWVCGTDLALKKSTTDAHGFDVHESCYTARLKMVTVTSPKKPNGTTYHLET